MTRPGATDWRRLWSAAAALCLLGGPASGDTNPDEGATPRIEAPTRLHYFGVMQPGQVARHRFPIRNKGAAPLEVSSIKGSCKCLQFRVDPEVIPPGGEGSLLVIWRAAEKSGDTFRQQVRIETNDPKNKWVDFSISGEVGGHLRLLPGTVEWKNAKPGEPRTASVRISTTFWEELHVSNLRCSVDGLVCELAAASPGSTSEPSRELTIRAPASLATKPFAGLITMTVSPHAAAEGGDASGGDVAKAPVEIQLPVSFGLGTRFKIVGAGFDELENRVVLGTQARGAELRRRLLVKVRDEQTELKLSKEKVVPDCVELTFTEYNAAKGLYRIELLVPPNSLDRGYVGEQAGSVELEFDHPRIKELKFGLEVSPGN